MIKRKIEVFNESNPLPHLYEFGISPDEVKELIMDNFSPYFSNKKNLEIYATSGLVNNWLSYITVKNDFPESLGFIQDIIDIFNGAKKANHSQTIEAYLHWFPDISHSMSRFWSLVNHQPAFKDLCIEDFLEVSMDTIGKTIEGLSKNFILLLVHLNRIRRNKACEINEIKSKDLGIAIDELINTTNLKDIFIIPTNKIRLNQWRNIAYHHNAKVVNNEMVFSYNQKEKHFDFKLSREELFNTVKRIVLTFKLIRIAETIFCFDNLDSIQQGLANIDLSTINIREEARLIDFYSSIGSQGFKVISLETNTESSTLQIIDMRLYSDYTERGAHSSQLLYSLWQHSNSKNLAVEYHTFNGKKFLTSKISSHNFENTEKTQLFEVLTDVRYMLHLTQYQNENPFSKIKISKRLKKSNDHFLSQLKEKICLAEFIKQFTLSVFCNYLVLKSEGFSETEISINVGGDGTLTIGKGKIGQMILHTPAKIEELEIQKIILKAINKVIQSFNKSKIKVNLVEDAMQNNKYYFKKHLVKDQLKSKQSKENV
jgi:hypothetical protein